MCGISASDKKLEIGGWFALLYGGQEQSSVYRDMMIIGHIRNEDLGLMNKMPERVTLTISLDG